MIDRITSRSAATIGHGCVAALAFCLIAGCHSSGSSADSTPSTSSTATQASASPAPAASEPAKIPIPPDSLFARVQIGMDVQEVYATIGQPTSHYRYATGKAFIPFHHYQGDNHRMTAHYKGIGTITFSQNSAFSGGMSVISIDYDPNEPGFQRAE